MTGPHTCCLRLNANNLFSSFSHLQVSSQPSVILLAAYLLQLRSRCIEICVRGSIWKGLCCRLRHVCCSHPQWVPWVEPIGDAERFGVTGWCFQLFSQWFCINDHQHTQYIYIYIHMHTYNIHSFNLCGTCGKLVWPSNWFLKLPGYLI